MNEQHEDRPFYQQPMRTANIAPNSDMNDGIPPAPKEPDIPDFSPLPDEVLDDLPPLLRQACEQFKNSEQQEIFLIGALGVLSGIMPNVTGVYDGKRLAPNLYCFVVGRYGTGKGSLTWTRSLGESVDEHRVKQATAAIAAHNEAMLNYNRQVRLYDKGKLASAPEMPKPPKHLKLFLPANATKTAVMQLLMENNGRGIIFETEGDTLADMLRQDYGNFSDVLRKAYHHEPISYYRRQDNEDVKINFPCLSVLLTGTDDQLRKLIPSIENGLFSRFCFYKLQGGSEFRDPFAADSYDLEAYFNHLGELYCDMYKKLEAMTEPVYFSLQPQQKAEFIKHFNEQKADLHDNISADLDGMMNRMGVICFRIAMILTVVRSGMYAQAGATLHCTDADFGNAMAITRHLLQYSLHVYELLQHKQGYTEAPIQNKAELIDEVCRCHKAGFSVRSIADSVLGDRKKSSTVYKWIKKFCKAA